jgi:hypothetical protein
MIAEGAAGIARNYRGGAQSWPAIRGLTKIFSHRYFPHLFKLIGFGFSEFHNPICKTNVLLKLNVRNFPWDKRRRRSA